MILIWSYILLIHITHVHSIICHGQNACSAQTIECDDTQDCFVDCSGFQACRDTIINCPTDHQCIIKCYTAPDIDITTNTLTCYRMTIHAQQSSSLNLIADIGNIGTITEPLRTAEEVTIYCPIDGKHPIDPSLAPCQITCDGDDLIRQSQIYAVAGFNDLHITSTFYATSWCIRAATVHCTPNFAANCSMTNFEPFQCQQHVNQNTDTTCDTYTYSPTSFTLEPTPNPTNNPTPSPTFRTHTPTIDPTITPSNNPTSTPTNNPTNTPTIHPTNSPIIPGFPTTTPTSQTTAPTSYPTTAPTKVPTSTPTNNPTTTPTINPTPTPTFITNSPTSNPTETPTYNPTTSTISPTETPTNNPTSRPTESPITPNSPTRTPTHTTYTPSKNPTTISPTYNPSTISPTNTPTTKLTPNPTVIPTSTPLKTCCGCVDVKMSPGCLQDSKCEKIICKSDIYCCQKRWDLQCVQDAQPICDVGTQAPTTIYPTQVTNTPTIMPTITVITTTHSEIINTITIIPSDNIENLPSRRGSYNLSTTELLLALLLPLLAVACVFMSCGICLLKKNSSKSGGRIDRKMQMKQINTEEAKDNNDMDIDEDYIDDDNDNDNIEDDESNSSDLFLPGIGATKSNDNGELMNGKSNDSYIRFDNKQKTESTFFTNDTNRDDGYSDSTIDL